MTRVEQATREGLLARREQLLEAYGTTLEEFAARAQQYALVGPEWEAWDELEKIAFLLGDDDA